MIHQNLLLRRVRPDVGLYVAIFVSPSLHVLARIQLPLTFRIDGALDLVW